MYRAACAICTKREALPARTMTTNSDEAAGIVLTALFKTKRSEFGGSPCSLQSNNVLSWSRDYTHLAQAKSSCGGAQRAANCGGYLRLRSQGMKIVRRRSQCRTGFPEVLMERRCLRIALCSLFISRHIIDRTVCYLPFPFSSCLFLSFSWGKTVLCRIPLYSLELDAEPHCHHHTVNADTNHERSLVLRFASRYSKALRRQCILMILELKIISSEQREKQFEFQPYLGCGYGEHLIKRNMPNSLNATTHRRLEKKCSLGSCRSTSVPLFAHANHLELRL